MSTLTKSDLIASLFLELGLNKHESKELVELFFDTILSYLEKGHVVKLANLGNFDLLDKASRPGRNPKTMEEKQIEARRVVVFHPSKKLKTPLKVANIND